MSDIKTSPIIGPKSLSALRNIAVPQGTGGGARIPISQNPDPADMSVSRIEPDEEEPKSPKNNPWANLFGHC